jgi:glycosyltransferase involved in cell wall biosynthesis
MEKVLTKKGNKVLVVSQYFWPENFRVNELVLELKKKGFDVEVLTSTPNYPSGKVFPDYLENPSKYKDYSGINVHRVSQFARGNNFVSLALNYFSFVISACFYCLFRLRNSNFDLIFGVQLSPIFSMLPAILCKQIMNAPLHLWVLDIWPDSLEGGGVTSKVIISPLRNLCAWIYSSAHTIFISSKGFEVMLNQMGVVEPEFVYFPQWIESDYQSEASLGTTEDIEVRDLVSEWKDKVIFTFTGNIGDAQDFPSVLEGVKKSAYLKEFVILVVGDGRYKTELIKSIKVQGLENKVICLGQYPARYMPFFYHYSQYLLVSLKDLPVYGYTLPGKVQSYMSSGRPVIGMINGEARQVIDEAGCGFTVASGDHIGFGAMLDYCIKLDSDERGRIGSLGRSYANKNFRLESLIDKVISHL